MRTEIEGGECNKSAVAKNLERQSILAAMLYRDLSLYPFCAKVNSFLPATLAACARPVGFTGEWKYVMFTRAVTASKIPGLWRSDTFLFIFFISYIHTLLRTTQGHRSGLR